MSTSAEPGSRSRSGTQPPERRGARAWLPGDAGLEAGRCLFCAAGTPTSVVFDDPPFAVVRCAGCRLVFVSPRIAADRVVDVYGPDYWRSPAAKDYGYTDYRADAAHWLRTCRRRFGVVGHHFPRGARVLDVGCAAGFFGHVLRDRGFEVWGVEVSAPIAAEAKDRLGADRVHIGTLASFGTDHQPFDAVTFWDVVEHLVDPVDALRRARRLLRPGGVVLIETQNVESRFARLMGRRWQHFKQAEHLYHFSPSTVTRLLEAAGFRVEDIGARGAGKYVGLDFVAERAGRVHPVLSTILSPLSAFPHVAPYVNLMDEMIVIATSPA